MRIGLSRLCKCRVFLERDARSILDGARHLGRNFLNDTLPLGGIFFGRDQSFLIGLTDLRGIQIGNGEYAGVGGNSGDIGSCKSRRSGW